MATNEDLAIAFLCLCDRHDKDELEAFILETTKSWDDKENIQRILEGIRLPISMVQRKIALLQTGLYTCPVKKRIYEEMANRLGNLTAGMRSPFLKPKNERSVTSFIESREHIMPLNLCANQSSQE